ncbi:MAG: xanthine dehydrogenase family protein molybdopterin-binding subunit, partial [Chloroflexota bacterium]
MRVPEQGQYTGQSIKRVEDPRLLRGAGLYVADVHLPGEVHLAVLRSPFAHARIVRIDVGAARACPGVLAAFSFEDLRADPFGQGGSRPSEGEQADVAKLPMLVPHKQLRPRMPYPLAAGKVRYAGEAVAVVAAQSRYLAEDALDAIEVEYQALPVLNDGEAALEDGAALVHDDMEDNLCAAVTQTVGDPDQAFAEADVTIERTFRFGRVSGQPMETRGVVARWERGKLGDTVTMWDATQSPHTARRVLAGMFGLPQHAILVVAPDVGGGFGIKNRFYAEEFLVPYVARLLGRPVRWIEDRLEDLLTTYQAREQIHHLEVAAKRDGTILAVRNRFTADVGAYSPFGLV